MITDFTLSTGQKGWSELLSLGTYKRYCKARPTESKAHSNSETTLLLRVGDALSDSREVGKIDLSPQASLYEST